MIRYALAAFALVAFAAAVRADDKVREVREKETIVKERANAPQGERVIYARVEDIDPRTGELTLSGWDLDRADRRRELYSRTEGSRLFERETVDESWTKEFPAFKEKRHKLKVKYSDKAPVSYEYSHREKNQTRWIDRPADARALRRGQVIAVRVDRDPKDRELYETRSIIIMGDRERLDD